MNRLLLSLAVLVLLAAGVVTGCRSATPAPAPDPPFPVAEVTAPEPPLPTEEPEPGAAEMAVAAGAAVVCWETEETVVEASGSEKPGAKRVIRMGLQPGGAVLLQDVIRHDASPSVPTNVFHVTWNLDGASFELEEQEGSYSGSGTATGEWPWTGWSSGVLVSGAIRVDETASVAADATLELQRQVFGPDGQAVMTLRETGRPLTPAECEARFTAAAP